MTSISLFEIVNVAIPESKDFLYIPAPAANAADINPKWSTGI